MSIKVDILNGTRFEKGRADVIGKHPKYRPYINFSDKDGRILVSIDGRAMYNIIRAWNKAKSPPRKAGKDKGK